MTHPESLCYRLAPEGGWVDIDLQRWAAFRGGDGAFPEHAGSAQVFALVEVIEEAGRLYAADLVTHMIELDDAGRARGRPTTLTPLDLVDCSAGIEEAELAADTSAGSDPLRERWSTLLLVATLQLRALLDTLPCVVHPSHGDLYDALRRSGILNSGESRAH